MCVLQYTRKELVTMANTNLHKAKVQKNDEFYTQLSDIEKELKHYREHFKDKTVFCNCDDPEYSNFWQYFSLNFEFLGLKEVVSAILEFRQRTKQKKQTINQRR